MLPPTGDAAHEGRTIDPSVGPPRPLSDHVRRRFSRQRIKDTAPEIALRRELHAIGLRYRINYAALPGVRRRPDVVFTAVRVAVFIDGCFWHRCPEHAVAPKNNAAWWSDKLQHTVDRDRDTDLCFTTAGWLVVRIWEHEPACDAAARIDSLVRSRRSWPATTDPRPNPCARAEESAPHPRPRSS